MELAGNGWQVTVAEGQVIRLDDLPLAAWERIVSLTEIPWVDAYYKPLSDLSLARQLVIECCKVGGIDSGALLEAATGPIILGMFEAAGDDLPVEVADGIPLEGAAS